MEYSKAKEEILFELTRAQRKYSRIKSSHEGYSLLNEQMDKLWVDVKAGRYPDGLTDSAKKVGAMALRFLIDCC